MAPKRKGRPRKADKPADDDAKTAPAEPIKAAEDDVKEEEEETEKAEDEPSPKKSKAEEKKKQGRKPKAAPKKAAAASKKSVDQGGKDSAEAEEAEEGVEEEAPAKANSEKVIVIEASKECNCFKTRAAKVQTGLTKAFPGIEVLINPDKPRKGCFEVRGKDGNIYLSMLGMPRPFTKLKSLDMDKTVDEIIAKVK